MTRKIMLLGSGELGKEFVIAAQRLGQTVVACDKYPGAPAMQVADACEVFDMLDGDALEAAVAKHRPDIIVPEIEAIRTERLYDIERQGVQVVPSARAVNFTMNRKAIRDLAAKELGLKTARYFYAKSYDELCSAAARIGFPCVVKPLMSSSGKGQSVVKGPEELEHAWNYGCEGSRGDIRELIVEEFIRFDSEITLLTVTQQHGPTLFCPPIGHVQKGGDYRESFQSPAISPEHLAEAQRMAAAVTGALTGAGIWSPRHGHGDAGRNAESQRVRAAPAGGAGASDPRNHVRTHGGERRDPLARGIGRSARIRGDRPRAGGRSAARHPHFRETFGPREPPDGRRSGLCAPRQRPRCAARPGEGGRRTGVGRAGRKSYGKITCGT